MDRKKKRLLSPLLERTQDALKGQRSMQTLENYHSSINKVKEFVGDGWEHLTVEDITRGWTDRFTTWLESHHGDKPQTVDFYLRTFRAVYGHALALSSEGTDGKPFSGHHRRQLSCQTCAPERRSTASALAQLAADTAGEPA